MLRSLGFVLLFMVASAQAAFEVIQSVGAPVVFDPVRPGPQFWHTLPQRLVDDIPHIQLTAAQPYGLTALRTVVAEATLRPGPFGAGLSCTAVGQRDYYGELLMSAAVAALLRSWLALGLGVQYGRVYLGERFGALSDAATSAGLRLFLHRRLSLDVAANGLRLSSRAYPLFAQHVSGGLTWEYSHDLALLAGFSSSGFWHVGETIRLSSGLALAASLTTEPLKIEVGTLFTAGRMGFDFLYRDDPELGGNLVIGVRIRL